MARKGGADIHDIAGETGGESWADSAEAAALRAACGIKDAPVVDQQAVFRGKLVEAIGKLRRRMDMRPEGEGAAAWLLNELHRDMGDVRADVMRTVIGDKWTDLDSLSDETAATRLMDYYATAIERATRATLEDGGGKKKKKNKAGPETTGLSHDPLRGAILGILMEIEDAGVDPDMVAAARRSILQLGDALAMPASRGPVLSNLRKLAGRSKKSREITELINALAW